MSEMASHPRNPLRTPDWRWIRSTTPRSKSPRAGRHDDDWVRRARRFQKILDRFGGDPGHPGLLKADPHIRAAHQIRFSDERRRWEFEARLLAGQNDAEIAARIGVQADVVEAYEALFYQVRSRLQCTDWVAAFLFGRRLYEGLDPADIELTWKVFAYHLGPHVLDALINQSSAHQADQTSDDHSETSAATTDRLAMAMSAMALRVAAKSAPKLVRLSERLEEIECAAACRSASAVFKPIMSGDQVGRGVEWFIAPKPRILQETLCGFVEVDRPQDDPADDFLPVMHIPFNLPDSIAEVAVLRRATG